MTDAERIKWLFAVYRRFGLKRPGVKWDQFSAIYNDAVSRGNFPDGRPTPLPAQLRISWARDDEPNSVTTKVIAVDNLKGLLESFHDPYETPAKNAAAKDLANDVLDRIVRDLIDRYEVEEWSYAEESKV